MCKLQENTNTWKVVSENSLFSENAVSVLFTMACVAAVNGKYVCRATVLQTETGNG